MIINKKYYSYLWRLISLGSFFGLWETASRLKLINPVFVSRPTDIVTVIWELFATGPIWPHLLISLKTFFIGLIVAIIIGISFGIIVGFFDNLYDWFWPYIYTLNALPISALIPLFIIWFGIGLTPRIIMVTIMAVRPILINVIDSVRNADKKLIEMARSFGASNFFILRSVIFFNILPFIFSGIRMALLHKSIK